MKHLRYITGIMSPSRAALKHSTLQRVLVIPFVLLVVALAGVIYWASYRSSESASSEFSQKVLLNMVERVNQATETHLLGARVAIKTIATDAIYSPADKSTSFLPFSDDPSMLEERMWVATGFFPTVNNYVYYAGADGRFVGINRRADRIELRLRQPGNAPRHVISVAAPGKRLGLVRTDDYDARVRPWYKSAVEKGRENWSEVYTDFTTVEPTFTLTKPVYRDGNKLVGVAATDLSLTQLTDFFQSLTVSRNGIAFIVERSGAIIATSTKERPYRLENKALMRMMADQSESALLRQAYAHFKRWQAQGQSFEEPVSSQFEGDCGTVQVAVKLLRDPAGLEWITVVAVPRSDFIGNVTSVLYQSLAIGLVAVLMVLVLGYALLQWVLRDIRKLTRAAQTIGLGAPLAPLDIQRGDEIGLLAKSFQEMERNLRTDKLTGVLNRESLLAQIDFRQRNMSGEGGLKFALLFLDLDRFKQINDQHGHGAGDRVLVETAQRLKSVLRASDEVARFGGDEFVIYLHGIDAQEDIDTVCEKISIAVEAPIEIRNGVTDHVSASMGLARYPADGMDIDTIVRVADMRMLELKKARRSSGGPDVVAGAVVE
jgi:diguanylate cyclase (GGDEF)-like protein